MTVALAIVMAVAFGCGTAQRPTTETDDCPPLPTGGQEAYDQAVALKVEGAEYSKERQRLVYRRIGLFAKAAKAGHLDGQQKAGGLMFTRMFEE